MNRSLFASILLLLALPALSDPYDQAMRRVRVLSNSPHVRLLQFGKSADGRALPAFVISDFTMSSEKKSRLLVCAGQHGDEPNPVWAVLSLSGRLAAGARPDLLKRCVIVVVPVVNPDGFAVCKRLNAQGRDVNRDWAALNSPEARFVDQLIKLWRPHAMIDTHEWNEPTLTAGNEIESPPTATRTQSAALLSMARRVEQGSALAAVRCSPNGNPTLFHRRYAANGYAAFLVETAAGVSRGAKSRAYSSAIVTLAKAASDSQHRAVLSPSSKRFCLSLVAPYLEPLPAEATSASDGFLLALVMAAGYCLMIWLIRPSERSPETTWSRRFRVCSVEPDIDSTRRSLRHSLHPITSKSWINRRLRSRYAPVRSCDP